MGKRLSIIIITVIILFTGINIFLATRLEFDFDFEHFFPKGDPDLDYFLEFRNNFENDNDYVLIAVGNSNSVFNTDFLEKVNEFSDELENLDHVESILSPTKITQPIISSFGYMEIPLVHINDASKLKNDSIRILNSKEYMNTFFSEDFKSLCIVIRNQQIISKKASDELLTNIELLLAKYQFEDVHYAGKIRGQKEYLTKMQQELVVFISISFFLIVLFLFLSFRSFSEIVVPVATVLIAIIGVLGFMSLLGKSLNIMTTLLPTILFVVGMSDAVHILNKYIEELRSGVKKLAAIKTTFKEIGMATLLTSITTAIGFITLMIVNVKPVQEFGLYTAIGVILAFVVAILLLPAVFSIIPPPKIANRKSSSLFWNKALSRTFILSIKNPIKTLVVYALLIVFSAIGISQLEINYHILEDLSEDNALQQDFRFFENTYSGIRPFEMMITANQPTDKILDYTVMKEMDKVEHYLYDNYKAGFLFSPVTVIKSLNKATHGGKNKYYTVPATEKKYNKLLRKLKNINLEKELKAILSKDQKSARFSGKMDDVGSRRVSALNADFANFFNAEIDNKLISYKMTGTAMLIDKNNDSLSVTMIKGLGAAFLLIALIIGFLFRSIKMAIISLIPNIVPLALIGGLMGFVGTSINISTSIIFTIAFGIAVDDTIHFLSRFRIEQQKKKSFLYVLKRTYLSTGKAIVLTTLILCGGFLSLIFSDFKSTFLIGVYVTLILFFAVITDLFLLPVLLLIFRNRNKV